MNNCKKYYTWLMALTAAAFIITAVCIQFMADSVPMHYNFHGEIDRYGSKNENFDTYNSLTPNWYYKVLR